MAAIVPSKGLSVESKELKIRALTPSCCPMEMVFSVEFNKGLFLVHKMDLKGSGVDKSLC